MIKSIGLAQFDFERREVAGNLFNSSADLIPGVFEPPFGILGIIRHALDSAVEASGLATQAGGVEIGLRFAFVADSRQPGIN